MKYAIYVHPDQVKIPLIDSIQDDPEQAATRIRTILEEGSFGRLEVIEVPSSPKLR